MSAPNLRNCKHIYCIWPLDLPFAVPISTSYPLWFHHVITAFLSILKNKSEILNPRRFWYLPFEMGSLEKDWILRYQRDDFTNPFPTSLLRQKHRSQETWISQWYATARATAPFSSLGLREDDLNNIKLLHPSNVWYS